MVGMLVEAFEIVRRPGAGLDDVGDLGAQGLANFWEGFTQGPGGVEDIEDGTAVRAAQGGGGLGQGLGEPGDEGFGMGLSTAEEVGEEAQLGTA